MSNEDIQLNVAIAAGRSIKQSMKDPSSFHLENLYLFPDGSACFEYRAKNSFNATVPGKAVFDAKAGAITVSDENEHKLVSAWNRICTRTGATNNAKGIRQLGLL